MIASFHVYLYGPDGGPLPVSFEDAAKRLQELPKLGFEWDGSFVWAKDRGQQQVYGMMYDAAGSIQYCELQGQCDLRTWQTVCKALIGSESLVGSNQTPALKLMRLPESEWQDFQSFENLIWQPQDSSTDC
jgi:hypothetical protein